MLNTISPIDGRYRKYTEPLAEFFSEQAFIKYRVKVEIEYLNAFLKIVGQASETISLECSEADVERIKEIEKTTNHDLKAIEYWMGEKLPEVKNWIHFGITSEDANNIAYALMIRDAIQKVIIPKLDSIMNTLNTLRDSIPQYPMLARTHGQPASPTTFGKEMAVFTWRLNRQVEQLKSFKLLAKLNGATGNY